MASEATSLSVETQLEASPALPAVWQVALNAFGKGVLIAATVVTAMLGLEFDLGLPRILVVALMGFLGFALVSLGEGLAVLAWKLLGAIFRGLHLERAAQVLRAIPPVPIGRITGAFFFIAGDILWPESFFKSIALPVAGEIAIVLGGFAAMTIALARMDGRSRSAQVALVAAPVLLALGLVAWVVYPGTDDHLAAVPPSTLEPAAALENPGLPGPYAVATLTYGSGTNTRRPEFGAEATLTTPTVDGSAVFGGYSSLVNSYFRWFWGFDFTELPLNGTVWYPEGAGPFPLVLIAHGNHPMSDYSDPGYAYLGEHLAGQGYIAASVDENFLNGLMFFDGEFKEMPLRAWLLLQHLGQWRTWNETAGHPFAGKVDLERVALIGHSRGGEAVAWASHLNRREMEPVSNVSAPEDFGFGIRGVVAIAPSDAYGGPGNRKPNLEDTSYLLLAGGHDADTYILYGQQQYNRIQPSQDSDAFKALAYVYQANHGQFNTVWGNQDRGLYNSLLLNRAPLLAAEEQQQAAKVLITSFLEASLKGDDAYRTVFANPMAAADWLPEGLVVTQLQEASFAPIDTNRGSSDVTATELGGAQAAVQGTSVAEVVGLKLRDDETLQGNKALRLSWDAGSTPIYEIALAEPVAADRTVTPDTALTFALAAVPGEPSAQTVAVELEDADGRIARAPLSAIGPVMPALPARLTKANWLYGLNGFPGDIRPEEIVLQTYKVPLADFATEGGSFDPSQLQRIRLRFDGRSAGAVYVDEVGLTD